MEEIFRSSRGENLQKRLDRRQLPFASLEELWTYHEFSDQNQVKPDETACLLVALTIETNVLSEPLRLIKRKDEQEAEASVCHTVKERHHDELSSFRKLGLGGGVCIVIGNRNHANVVQERQNDDKKRVDGAARRKDDGRKGEHEDDGGCDSIDNIRLDTGKDAT